MNPLGPLYSPQFVVLIACAIAFYKGAEVEGSLKPVVWMGVSTAMFFLTWMGLHCGLMGNLIGQAAVVGVVTVVRTIAWRMGK
jgi:uncharacterized membrane-anchored protein